MSTDPTQPPEPSPAPPLKTQGKPRPVLPSSKLMLGLIPVLLGAVMVILLAWQMRRPLLPRYRDRADACLKKGDLVGAQLSLRKMLEIKPEQPDVIFNLARVYAAMGLRGRAEQLVRPLTATGPQAMPGAQLWLAERLLEPPFLTPERRNEAESLLVGLLRKTPGDPRVRLMLGMIYAQTNRPGEALPLLIDTAQDRPLVLQLIAECKLAMKDPKGAEEYRNLAYEAAKKGAAARPDAAESWAIWSATAQSLGKYEEALEHLAKADAIVKSPATGMTAARIVDLWVGSLAPRGVVRTPQTQLKATEIVEKGLNVSPSNPALIQMLESLLATERGGQGPILRRIEALTSKLATRPAALVVLGNQQYARKKLVEARAMWEEAYKLAPEIPVLANNLSWSLAYEDPSDPKRALEIIDRLVKQAPDAVYYRVTRGQVLNKLGRYDEALAELERVLNAGWRSVELREALVVSYQNLGKTGALKSLDEKFKPPAAPGRG